VSLLFHCISLTLLQFVIAIYGKMSHRSYRFKRLLVAFWPERLKLRKLLASSSLKDILSAYKPKAGESLPEGLSPIIETGKSVYYRGLLQSRPHAVGIFYDNGGMLGPSGLKPARRSSSRSKLRLEVFSFVDDLPCYAQHFSAVSFQLRKCRHKLARALSSEGRTNLRRCFRPGRSLALSLAFKQQLEACYREQP
jgi:hypothetical protein